MKTAVITFGRFNPPTIGHQKLVDHIRSVARLEKGDPLVFLSHSQDAKKNPLDYSTKLKYAIKAFGKVVVRSRSNTIIKVLQEVSHKYERLILVVGSDRVSDMDKLVNAYNGKDYTFQEINVVSAGDRDPDADDASGMSASKMRSFVAEDDFDSFAKGLPKLLERESKKLYNDIKKGMKL